MRNVPNKVVGDTYTSQELNEGGLDEDKHMITDTLQNFDNTSASQKMQAVILAAGNRLTYIENTGSTGSAYKVKNLQSTSDQAKFIQNGFKFSLIFTNENTVINPTIEFDGILGTYNIVDKDSNPIKLSLFKSNSIVEFVYNGTNLVVASVLTSQEDINKNNSYTSVYTSPNYLLTNNVANPTAYYDGMVVNFIANAKSDASVTLTIYGLTAIALLKGAGEVSYNDIVANSVVSAIYYNGNFYLLKSNDNFVVNSENTYSFFDKDNNSRKSAFNINGLVEYAVNTVLTSNQSHQKIKIVNTANTVQLTLPQQSTCDDNCEYPIMIESSSHAASFVAHAGDTIMYNGTVQASINFVVDNGNFLIKKDNSPNTWIVSGYNQSTTTKTGVAKIATQAIVNAKTDNTSIVTSLTLNGRFDKYYTQITPVAVSTDVNLGSSVIEVDLVGLGLQDKSVIEFYTTQKVQTGSSGNECTIILSSGARKVNFTFCQGNAGAGNSNTFSIVRTGTTISFFKSIAGSLISAGFELYITGYYN